MKAVFYLSLNRWCKKFHAVVRFDSLFNALLNVAVDFRTTGFQLQPWQGLKRVFDVGFVPTSDKDTNSDFRFAEPREKASEIVPLAALVQCVNEQQYSSTAGEVGNCVLKDLPAWRLFPCSCLTTPESKHQMIWHV